MKIAVNTRLVEQKKTGVQEYIIQLYKNIQYIDKKNEYVFFQSKTIEKPLGKTFIFPSLQNILGYALFDLVFVNLLIFIHKPDIYHGCSHTIPLFKRKKTKYVVTIMDLAFLKYPEAYSKLFVIYYKLVTRFAVSHADLVMAISECTKQDIIEFYKINSDKVFVVPLGYSNKLDNESEIEGYLPKDAFYFTLTTHIFRKNTLGILEAISKEPRLANTECIIAGHLNPDEEDILLNRIAELSLKNVRYVGYISRALIDYYFRNAKFFIYPSFYEGFGIPVLDAISNKCLVIASNTSSIPELLSSKKFLVDPFNPDDIAKKMLGVLDLNKIMADKIIMRNLKHIEKYTWQNCAAETTKLFNSISIDIQ